MTNSCIYDVNVIHKRFKPKVHFFKYKVFSLLIDLSELNELNNKLKFFSLNRFNLISFYEKDDGDRDGSSLFNELTKCPDEKISPSLFKLTIRVLDIFFSITFFYIIFY